MGADIFIRSRLAALFAFAFLPASLWATVERYESGLPQRVDRLRAEAPIVGSEDRVVAAFLQESFSTLGPGFAWAQIQRIPDTTHVHLLYELRYGGRRVVGAYLRMNYHRGGWVQYALSTLKRRFSLSLKAAPTTLSRRAEQRWSEPGSRLSSEPVVWVSPSGAAREAVEVTVQGAPLSVGRRFVADPHSGEVLAEFRTARFNSRTPVNVYPVSPLGGDGGLGAKTITTTDAGKLVSDLFHVRRGISTGATTFSLNDVDPGVDYSGGIAADPASYNASCNGTNTNDCPNQAFDAVNVFYHVSTHRARIDGLLSELGVIAGTSVPIEQIPVIVNLPRLQLSATKVITSNNAAFLSDCTSVGFPKCLIFLKPASTPDASCESNPADNFDLAREASVITHEYQHYITDAITRIAFVLTTNLYTVGDALHEGYSDYFGVSHVQQESGTLNSKVLSYGFQECTYLQRDVAVPLVYDDNAADLLHSTADPHWSGLTWASGLWQLRTELGAHDADLLALKSQFFLSPLPGFVEAVEALVKADQALYAGAHVARIRTLFYQELKFLGSRPGLFTDPTAPFLDSGFRSCGAVHLPDGDLPPGVWLMFVVGVVWLSGVVLVGRKLRRPRERV